MPHRAILAAATLLTAGIGAAPAHAAAPRIPAGAQAGAKVTLAVTVKARSRPLTLLLSRDARRSADDLVLGTLRAPRTTRTTVLARRTVTVPRSAAGVYRLLGCSGTRCRVLAKTFSVGGVGSAPVGLPTTPASTTPTPPLTVAPVTTTPDTSTQTTTTTPPPPPPTGLQISPSPIVLGAMSRSATSEEITAANRLVTVTNLGPGTAPPIALYTAAKQGDTFVSSNAIGEAFDGNRACFTGLALKVGEACGVRLSWRAGFEAPASDMVGVFAVLDNTDQRTITAQAPMSAGYVSRAFFDVSGGISGNPVQHYFQNGELTITNIGDVAGGFDIEFTGPDAARYSRRPGFGTCQALGSGGLAKDASCTIGIRFCAIAPGAHTASVVTHAGSTTGPVNDTLPVNKTATAQDGGANPDC